MNKATIEGSSIPTAQEILVLKGFTYGMSPEEIATSLDKTVEEVGQDVFSLYGKWHNLEDLRKAQVRSQRGLQ